MKIVARSEKGREFFYIPSSARSVPVSSALKICNALNAAGYQLLAGEVWHVHDVDIFDTAYDYAQFQKFFIRSGKLYDTAR